MATGRSLRMSFSGILAAVYQNTAPDLDSGEVAESKINYVGLQDVFEDGQAVDQVDLLYSGTRNALSTSPESIDLDNTLRNIWGDALNFYKVKVIVIKNNETAAGKFLTVTFRDEAFYIGPNGRRIIWEPDGIQDNGGSSPGLSGLLSITASSVTNSYDLIIAGTSASG